MALEIQATEIGLIFTTDKLPLIVREEQPGGGLFELHEIGTLGTDSYGLVDELTAPVVAEIDHLLGRGAGWALSSQLSGTAKGLFDGRQIRHTEGPGPSGGWQLTVYR